MKFKHFIIIIISISIFGFVGAIWLDHAQNEAIVNFGNLPCSEKVDMIQRFFDDFGDTGNLRNLIEITNEECVNYGKLFLQDTEDGRGTGLLFMPGFVDENTQIEIRTNATEQPELIVKEKEFDIEVGK